MHRKVVLIVEDSPSVRMHIRVILEKANISLVEAANKKTMMDNIEQSGKPVDLVIMDLGLKRDSGLDLIKILKSDERYNEIPVFVMTANAQKDSILQAKNLGVAGYLLKPINKEDFLQRIGRILGI